MRAEDHLREEYVRREEAEARREEAEQAAL